MFYWNEFIDDINDTIENGFTVFDAGAGDGHWKQKIKKEVKYISMDLGVGDAGMDYSHLDIKGDLRNIPLDDNSVDIIICIQVLEHLPEPWKVINEFYRILKPGGYVFASCPQGEPQHQIPYDFFRYTIFGLDALFKSYKFSVDWIKPQKGNFSKIATDLRHAGNVILSENRSPKTYALILKAQARFIEKLFKKLDSLYTTNTVGHFIKAHK